MPKLDKIAITSMKYNAYLISDVRNVPTPSSIWLLSNPFFITFTTLFIILIPTRSTIIATMI